MNTLKISTPVDIVRLVDLAVGHVPPQSLVFILKQNVTGPGALSGSVRVDFDMNTARAFTHSTATEIADCVTRFGPCEVVIPVFSCHEIAHVYGHAGSEPTTADIHALIRAWLRIQRELLHRGIKSVPPVWASHNKCGWVLEPEECEASPHVETSTNLPALSALPAVRAPLVTECADTVLDDRDAMAHLLADAGELCAFALSESPPREWDSVHVSAGAVRAVEKLMEIGVCRDALLLLFSARHPNFRPDVVGHLSTEEFLETVCDVLENGVEKYIAGMDTIRPHIPYTYAVLMYLKLIAVHVKDEYFAELLGVIAWFEWVAGHNSYAQHFARSAMAINPDNGFATTIDSFVENGIATAWIT